MTQTVSAVQTVPGNKTASPAVLNGLFTFRRHIPNAVAVFLMSLLTVPMFVLYMASHSASPELEEELAGVAVLCALCWGAAMLAAGTVIGSAFRSSFSKQYLDMEHSLPMSASGRFFSDLAGGAAAGIIPSAAADIISLLLLLVLSGNILVSQHAEMIMKVIAAKDVIMLQMLALLLLCAVCCGKAGVSRFMFVIMLMLPFGALALFGFLRSDPFFLIGVDPIDSSACLLGAFSPLVGVYDIGEMISGYMAGNDTDFGYARWMVYSLCVTAAAAVISYLLYRGRTAEKTGSAFACKGLYYIVMTAVCFIVMFMLIKLPDALMIQIDSVSMAFLAVIATAAAYVIIELIVFRSFSGLYKTLIRYALTAAGCFIFITVIDKTGFFGVERYVPAASEVGYITLEDFGGYYNDDCIEELDLHDPENISRVIAGHSVQVDLDEQMKARLDQADIYSSVYYTGFFPESSEYVTENYVRINYHLRNGRTVTRRYRLAYEALTEMKDICLTEEYKTQLADSIAEIFSENKGSRTIRLHDKFCIQSTDHYGLPDDFYPRLTQCFRADIDAMTAEDYFTPSEPVFGYIESIYENRSSGRMIIRGCYKNTIAYLESIGVNACDSFDAREYGYLTLESPGKNAYHGTAQALRFDENGRLIGFTHGVSLADADEELRAAAGRVLSSAYTEYEINDGYILSYRDIVAYIPPERAADAEALMKEGEAQQRLTQDRINSYTDGDPFVKAWKELDRQ